MKWDKMEENGKKSKHSVELWLQWFAYVDSMAEWHCARSWNWSWSWSFRCMNEHIPDLQPTGIVSKIFVTYVQYVLFTVRLFDSEVVVAPHLVVAVWKCWRGARGRGRGSGQGMSAREIKVIQSRLSWNRSTRDCRRMVGQNLDMKLQG